MIGSFNSINNKIGIVLVMITFFLTSSVYSIGNIHIGTLEIHPFLDVEQEYDDNIYLQVPGDENKDWITTTTIGFEAKKPIFVDKGDNTLFEINYRIKDIRFKDNSYRNRVDQTANVLADFKFTNDFGLKVRDSFRKTADPPNSELTALDKRYRNFVEIMASCKREKIGFDVGYGNVKDDYMSRNNLDKSRDVVSGTFYYQIFPKTSIFGELDCGWIHYDKSVTNSNSTYRQLRAGVEGDVAPKLTGIFKVGYEASSYDDSSKKDFKGLTFFGDLIYDLYERSKLHFFLERGPVESTYSTNSHYVANRMGVKLNHQLSEKLFLDVNGFWDINKYPEETTEGSKTTKRKDDIWGFGIVCRYRMKEWVSLDIGYEYKRRDSEFSKYDYRDNKATVGMSFVF